jgi:alkylation response protein AidB-like acyl-CoA dehydrogenase
LPWWEYGLLSEAVTFVLSDDQEELRRVVRSFLAETSPPAEVRRLMETPGGYEPATWRRMADELGLHGLAIPEELGGMGFGWIELGTVFEEMGRALAGGPLLASVAVAAGVLLHAGDDAAAADLVPGIARGETVATLASGEGGEFVAGGTPPVLSGQCAYVLDGLVADLILVAAGGSLFAVEGTAPGITREPMGTMDLTRKLARLTFDRTPARLVGAEGAARPAVEAGLALGTIALANEQVGGAQRCLEMTLDYAKTRHQFGRPIGSFQAIKHACADVLQQIESARSTAAYANWAASHTEDEPGEMLLAASLAKAACSDAYVDSAAQCIQVHGALGFTWVHDAHLYFKRAKSSALLFGDPTHHRSVLADRLGL